MTHSLESGRQLLQDRHDRVVDEDDAVLRVVDDIGQLLGEQPDVERVQDRSDAGNGHVQLEVALIVPSERADAIALFDAKPIEHTGEAIDALCHFPVSGAHGATVGERDHLRSGMDRAHAVQRVVQRQLKVVLHQPFEHLPYSLLVASLRGRTSL